MQLLYVTFVGSDGKGASVILNGATVYHEDDDRGFSNPNFRARDLAKRLGKALRSVKLKTIRLNAKDLPEDWNFDDVEAAALKKPRSRLTSVRAG